MVMINKEYASNTTGDEKFIGRITVTLEGHQVGFNYEAGEIDALNPLQIKKWIAEKDNNRLALLCGVLALIESKKAFTETIAALKHDFSATVNKILDNDDE